MRDQDVKLVADVVKQRVSADYKRAARSGAQASEDGAVHLTP
jgi:hypothetical protein